jgi:hypothetical protein
MQVSQILIPAPATPDDALLAHCCVCGTHGPSVPRKQVFSKSTGAVSVLATVPSDCICCHCAASWGEPKKWGRAILATPGNVQFPTISPDPKGERPTWKQALTQLDRTQPRVCILTTDPKKRIWPFAQVSQGDRLSMYLHDPSRGVSGNRAVSLDALLSALEQIEAIYCQGFSKVSIEQGLLGDLKRAQSLGIPHSVALERNLQTLRITPEFLPALIIAQKEG